MLNIDNTVLLVVDVQGKLAQLMHDKDNFFTNVERMISGAQVLDLPIIWTEQVPEKLGETIPQLRQLLLENSTHISKISFSCWGEESFRQQLTDLNRKQLLITGLETHICVHQTTADLLELGYEIQLVTDAVSSRTAENRHLGITRMRDAGATLTSTEMALFELLRSAEGPKFKAISKLVK